MPYNKPLFKMRNNPDSPTKTEVLTENLLDAFIDGAIAGLLTGWLVNPEVSWKVALGVGMLKFLIRLKELRGKR